MAQARKAPTQKDVDEYTDKLQEGAKESGHYPAKEDIRTDGPWRRSAKDAKKQKNIESKQQQNPTPASQEIKGREATSDMLERYRRESENDDYEYPQIEDVLGSAKQGRYNHDIRALYQGAKHNYDGARKGIRSIVWHEFGKPAVEEFNKNYLKNLNGVPFNMDDYQAALKEVKDRYRWGSEGFDEFINGENGIRARLKAGQKVAEGYNPKNLPKYFYLYDRYNGADGMKGPDDIMDMDFDEAARAMGYDAKRGYRINPHTGKGLYYGYDADRNFIRDEKGRPKVFEDADGKMKGNKDYIPVPGDYSQDYDLWQLLAPAYYEEGVKLNPYQRYMPNVGELPADLDTMISRNPLIDFNPYQTVSDMRNVSKYLKNVDMLNNANYDPKKFTGSARPSYMKMDEGRKRLSSMMRDIEGVYDTYLGDIDPSRWDDDSDPEVAMSKELVRDKLDRMIKNGGDKGSWQDYANDYLGAYHHFSSDLQRRLAELEKTNPELANQIRTGMQSYENMPDMMKALVGGMAYEAYPYRDMMAYNMDPEKQRAAYAGNLDPGLYKAAGVDTSGIPKEISKKMYDLKKTSPSQYQSLIIPSSYENKAYKELRTIYDEKKAQDELASMRGKSLFLAANGSAEDLAKYLSDKYGMPPEEAMERASSAVEAAQYAAGITGRNKLQRAQQTMAEGHNKEEVAQREEELRKEDELKQMKQDTLNLSESYARAISAYKNILIKKMKEDDPDVSDQVAADATDLKYENGIQAYRDKYLKLQSLLNDPNTVLSAEEIAQLQEEMYSDLADIRQRIHNRETANAMKDNPELQDAEKQKQAAKQAYAKRQAAIPNTKERNYYSKVGKSEEESQELSQTSVRKMESFEEMMKDNEDRAEQERGYRQGIPVHSQVFKNTAYPVVLGNDGRDWKVLQPPAKKISDEGSVKKI